MNGWISRLLRMLVCAALPAQAAYALDSSQWFRAKSISLYAGFTPGGGIDSEMRLIAQYLGGFIPGAPTVVPMNMPGAGGILLANHLYSIDKPDGLTVGMPGRSGFVLAALTGDPSVRYKLDELTWIGSSGAQNPILWVRKGLKLATWKQLEASKRPIVVGGLAASSSSITIPAVLARFEKAPLRLISGYTGLSEAVLALERGEIDAIYTEVTSFRPGMVSSGEVVPLFQTFDIEPGLPSLEKHQMTAEERSLVDLIVGPSRVGAPVVAPPKLPEGALKPLRTSYLAMESDKGFRKEAARRGIAIGKPISGQDLQTFVHNELSNIRPSVLSDYTELVSKERH